MRYSIHVSILALFFCFGCSDESKLEELCESERMRFDNSVFAGTAIYCHELPFDSLVTSREEIEVVVDFYDSDSIAVIVDYLDPSLASYVIRDLYVCEDPEERDLIFFYFESENYKGSLNVPLSSLRLTYSSNTCETSYFTVFLK